jgi:hypothetical protein
MSRAELTDEAVVRVKKALIDAQSDNPRVRQAAMLEVKKLTVLYGSDALSGVEDVLAEEAYERGQEEAWAMGGPGVVWD